MVSAEKRREEALRGGVIKRKKFWVQVLVGLIIYGLISSFYLNYSWNRYEENAKDDAIMLAQSVKSMFHAEHLAQLTGTESDLETQEYSMAKSNLAQLVYTTNPIRFAYLVGLRNGQLVFLVDSEEVGSPDYSPPGQVYHDANPLFLQGIQENRTIITEPFTDRWGSWVSVLVPIQSPEGNEVIAAFVLDFPASQ